MRFGVRVVLMLRVAAVILAVAVVLGLTLRNVTGSTAGALGLALLLAGSFIATIQVARRTSPSFIQNRLREKGEYSITASGVWDPSRPHPNARLVGKARARYWLDPSGLVHLEYSPKQGHEQHLVGPMPEPPARRTRNKAPRHGDQD